MKRRIGALLTFLLVMGASLSWAQSQDFEISLLTATPELPTGVKQITYNPDHKTYYHQDNHGWCWYAIEFAVDTEVEITVGGCNYQNGYYAYLTDGEGTKIADIINDRCDGSFSFRYTGVPQTLRLYCGQYCPFIKVDVNPERSDVNDLHISTPATQTCYDLNGRLLKEPQPGVNIINGKKVLVK